MDGLCIKSGIVGIAPAIPSARGAQPQVCAMSRSPTEKPAPPPQKAAASAAASRFSFTYPLRSLWRGGGGSDRRGGDLAVDGGDEKEEKSGGGGGEANWVLRILQVNSIWRERKEVAEAAAEEEEESGDRRGECGGGGGGEEGEEGCFVCTVEDEEEVEFDRDSFSRLLRRVSLKEAKLYAQMSYLGNLAYSIPNIKPVNLLKYRGLHFVTSSMEKKELAAKAEEELQAKPEKEESTVAKTDKQLEAKPDQEAAQDPNGVEGGKEEEKGNGYQLRASAVYQIAASAASYLHSQTKSILPFTSSKSEASEGLSGGVNMMNSEMVSFKATTDSMTAVVAAKEEEKQAVANSLNSARSTPCDWFICDDDQSATRFFVIQGSESLESWQANLLFEPVQFEGLDVFVHRGIYEAAKGIYEQMLPEVRNHLKSRGRSATFRFTGHSLGGSLSLLVNLMLLIRGEVPRSSLLPVVTFGAPSIMCGGDHLLRRLGLPRSHVQSVTLHRDIVPRAFSCNYPNHIAELLKAVNGNFRNHPCLDKQKLLYAPMGELLILQPEETVSPRHHLLPSGSGLFLLCCPLPDSTEGEKQLQAAKMVFINSPHPLEILRDRSAYGAEGSIHRDHDMNSYLKSVRNVVRQELRRIRKAERDAEREQHQKVWWGFDASVIFGQRFSSLVSARGSQVNFSGVVKTGKESARRFGRLVASQHMQLFVLLFFPVRMLLVGAYNAINLG